MLRVTHCKSLYHFTKTLGGGYGNPLISKLNEPYMKIKCTSPCLSLSPLWQDAGIKAAHAMPAPEIGVSRPCYTRRTLTKSLGYRPLAASRFSSARVSGITANHSAIPSSRYIKDKCFSKLNQLFIKIMCDRQRRL